MDKRNYNSMMDIERYTYNLFAFPEDYFTSRTAEELEISEEGRQEIIRRQQNAKRYQNDPEYRAYVQEERRKEFEAFKRALLEADNWNIYGETECSK